MEIEEQKDASSIPSKNFIQTPSNLPSHTLDIPKTSKGYKLADLLGNLVYKKPKRSQYRKHIKDYCKYSYTTYFRQNWQTTSDSQFSSSFLVFFIIIISGKVSYNSEYKNTNKRKFQYKNSGLRIFP